MTSEQESRCKKIIDRQAAMSRQTLDALRAVGLTDEAKIQLDFFFIAPNEKAAKSLIAHLESNDCLDLSADKTGGFLSRKYVVKGKTHETSLSTEILDQGLPWMVVQGVMRDCEFDGWGAEV